MAKELQTHYVSDPSPPTRNAELSKHDSQSTLLLSPAYPSRNSIFPQFSKDRPEIYTTFSKILIVIGLLSMANLLIYTGSVYSALKNEFKIWFETDAETFFWFGQISLIVQAVVSIPFAIFMTSYLKQVMQLSVVLIIVGSALKVGFAHSLIANFVGQALIQFSAPLVFLGGVQIGAIIFDACGMQIWMTWQNIVPNAFGIVTMMFPPLLAKHFGGGEIIYVCNLIGIGFG
jgi:hypothetical protein